MGQQPGVPVGTFPSSTENQVEPTKRHSDWDKEGKGKRRKSFITKCTKNRTSALPQFCQLAQWKYCIGSATELILLLQNSTTAKKMWQRRNGEDTACWRNGKLCVFGIHVTALLKNASKQLWNSWDWVWAQKVVTIIQTSVARMEESCCL